MSLQRFFGKYRGKVKNNLDPLQLGRLQVEVPAVLGTGSLSWAMPCVAFAGPGVGFFALPPDNANVWVEFEGGDPDFPIWAGCFWDVGQVPAKPASPFSVILKTQSISLQLMDTPGGGGVTLEVLPPAVTAPLKLSLTSTGIEIVNGKNSVKLTPVAVTINDGALEVI
jgi:hypothetical protein